VHICVLTLGYSRRQVVRVFRHQQQRHWLQSLEEAFRSWVRWSGFSGQGPSLTSEAGYRP
jgi:transposase